MKLRILLSLCTLSGTMHTAFDPYDYTNALMDERDTIAITLGLPPTDAQVLNATEKIFSERYSEETQNEKLHAAYQKRNPNDNFGKKRSLNVTLGSQKKQKN